MNDSAISSVQIEASPVLLIVFAAALIACLATILATANRIRSGRPLVTPVPHAAVSWGGFDVAIVMLLHLFCIVGASTLAGSGQGPVSSRQILAAACGMAIATVASSGVLVMGGASTGMLGFRTATPLADVRLGLVTLAGITPPLLVLAGLLDRFVPYRHPVVDLLTRGHDPGTVGAVILSAVVVAPIAEEFFFRKVLQGWLEAVEDRFCERSGRTVTGLVPVAASSILFALAHLEHGLGWIPLVAFGAAVGWLARQRGSILPGILVHALFNAVSVGLLLSQGSPGGE
ncbi:MAG: lysostaphin resistance A-like protein [Planctomycetaceae bacterium]